MLFSKFAFFRNNFFRVLFARKTSILGAVLTVSMMIIAITGGWIKPRNGTEQMLDFALQPVMFRGMVVQTMNPAKPKFPKKIAIQEYVFQGDSLHFKTLTGTKRTLHISDLYGQNQAEWIQQPLYILGTDRFGRDVLARLLEGSQVSIFVGVFAQGLSLLIGIIIGAAAGYFRGFLDDIITWIMTIVWSFPSVLLVIALTVALGQGLWQTFLAIGLTGWVEIARITRAQFIQLGESDFVTAAKALGYSPLRQIVVHIFPNALGPIIVVATAGFANAIIAESSLSFLGLGVQPPAASWGQMIRDGYGYAAIGLNIGLAFFPALCLAMIVFGLNLLGDGLRDAFDPKYSHK